MKQLLILFAFIPLIGFTQTPTSVPYIDLSKYHDANRLMEMVDSCFISLNKIYNIGDSTINDLKILDFDTTGATVNWQAGRMQYDSIHRTISIGSGIHGAYNRLGVTLWHPLVLNNNVYTLYKGTPVYVSGVENEYTTIDSARADSPFTSLPMIGLVAADVLPNSLGFVTKSGLVENIVDVPGPEGALIYLGSTGGTTVTQPISPDRIVIIGTVRDSGAIGIIDIDINHFTRPLANKSYSFTSNGIGAGTYYVGGFYEAPAADVTLNQASLTQTLGSVGNAYAAHAFIVAGDVGAVDAGQVGIRVIGNSITDSGINTAVDTAVVTDDITTLATDGYLETPEKWLGQITFELYEVSGTPTAYSLDFNYGYAKYEDFGNVDFSVTKIEAVGLAGATDANFDMTLLHHMTTGWTYSAAAFSPGSDVIADWSDIMGPNDNLVNTKSFAWKVTPINEFIHGDEHEGIIVRIVCGTNNSVEDVDVHIIGVVESF